MYLKAFALVDWPDIHPCSLYPKHRETFDKLSVEKRVSIFQEPLHEIVRMLEQNLLYKFHRRIALDRGAFVCGYV